MKAGKVVYKVVYGVCIVWLSVVLCVVVHYGRRALVADTFIIPSDSMLPTLLPGDKVRVDKTILGARLYTSLDFTDGRMESVRTRGGRGLRHNDIIVFNFPVNEGKMGFKMNFVYVKRCVALPGDSVSIRECTPVNNHYAGVLGIPEQQAVLRSFPDSLMDRGALGFVLVGDGSLGWTIKDMGPVYVPRKGDILILDDRRKAAIYRRVIEWETCLPLVWDEEKDECRSGGVPLPYYCFRKNYCFVCGDHAVDSKDSRYWGFVPEEYIVGVVSEVVSSYDPVTGRERKERRGLNLTDDGEK